MGFSRLNSEQKMRIPLSQKARIIMDNDRNLFNVPKTTFINIVFANYRDKAKASIAMRLQDEERRLDELLSGVDVTKEAKEKMKKRALEVKKEALLRDRDELLAESSASKDDLATKNKTYRLNTKNFEFLDGEDCQEQEHYGERPANYVRAVIEEYCRLPFIEREEVFRQDVYKTVREAIAQNHILQVQFTFQGDEKPTVFYVYPYKIMPDALKSQSFLTCYSQKKNVETCDQKKPAAFSMATIQLCSKAIVLNPSGRLKKQEKIAIQKKCDAIGPNYLLGKEELIKVRLTQNGIVLYRRQLPGRPDLAAIEENNIYVFNCSAYQARQYFLSFGKEAEILSPESLRKEFQNTYAEALQVYS